MSTVSPRAWRPSRLTIAAALAAAFAVRLAYGVTGDFWGIDELQVYLIGLKFFATGRWPFYGADVVYSETQLPGGLQGLLIAGPLWLLRLPEAPYVLLNLLSFSALLLLGWYITRRIPDVPRWFLWPTMFFSSWMLDVSTHVINTSYVVIGAVPFFVAAFEIAPQTRVAALSRSASYFAIGASIAFMAQIHLSVALLVPIALAVVVLDIRREPAAWAAMGWIVAGALVLSATLLPTLLFDREGMVGQVAANVQAEPRYLLRLPQLAAQFMSLASFELPRFIGSSTADRVAFLGRYPWAAPFVVFATIAGIVQAGVLLVGLVLHPGGRPDYAAVRNAAAAMILLVLAGFAASVKAPASHAFYVAMPVATIFAFYWWTDLLRRRAVRVIAVALLVSGGISHIAIALRNYADRSLYTNRPLVVRAIAEKNYALVGERRPFARDAEPR